MITKLQSVFARNAVKEYESGEGHFPESIYRQLLDSLKHGNEDVCVNLPDDFLLQIHRSMLERAHLEENYVDVLSRKPERFLKQGWMRLTRLPISPLEDKKYAMYPRWQNAIAAMHTMKLRFCYILMRDEYGETKLLLGAIPKTPGVGGESASNQLRQAISGQMPGIELKGIQGEDLLPLYSMGYAGAVTGIPSVRKITEYGEYQTLDQLALGLKNHYKIAGGVIEEEEPFALVIIADPISDGDIVDAMRTMENLGSSIHSLAQYTKSEGISSSESVSLTFTEGNNQSASIGLSCGGEKSPVKINLGGNASVFLSAANSRSTSVGRSEQVSAQYVNKTAMYCEELVDKHLNRLKSGRSMGFWKTGVYVMANTQDTVETIMGMLRATYSGDDTYVEPIRTTLFSSTNHIGARDYIGRFNLVPCRNLFVSTTLGPIYEDFATPITTEELSIATSLPRRDVKGLRLVRNASRFATNPPVFSSDSSMPLGMILDTGAPTYQDYMLSMNQLVKHTLVAGTNGSGKTTTCKNILNRLLDKGIPFLVIEPTKDEYISWAIKKNKSCRNPNDKILIFAPGLNGSFRGEPIQDLRINPFQPAGMKNAPLNMLGHIGRFKNALLGSMPMSDVLPLLMEEGIYEVVKWMDVSSGAMGKTDDKNNPYNPLDIQFRDRKDISYPLLSFLEPVIKKKIDGRNYENQVAANLKACIATRMESMLLGWKRKIFNVERSIDFEKLFERNSVVINLSHLTDDDDKAFLMSILLIALWEYRESKYNYDDKYRSEADQDMLKHLTLIEEAHRLMPNEALYLSSEVTSQANIARMFSAMLSELRAYGEGCMVVDQIPTRLIPDAVKNTNLKIVHRLTAMDDIKAVSAGMRLRTDQEQVVGVLQPGEAIVCSEYDDAAAWIKIHQQK